MVKAGFTDRMKSSLHSFCGQELLSLQYAPLGASKQAYCNILLKASAVSLELRNEEPPLPFFDTTEDVAVLTCGEIDGADFTPTLEGSATTYPIHEIIEEISIITDTIHVYNKAGNVEYAIQIDRGIIITTAQDSIIIFKGWHFDESLTMDRVAFDPSSVIRPTTEVERDWSDEESTAMCTRMIAKLS